MGYHQHPSNPRVSSTGPLCLPSSAVPSEGASHHKWVPPFLPEVLPSSLGPLGVEAKLLCEGHQSPSLATQAKWRPERCVTGFSFLSSTPNHCFLTYLSCSTLIPLLLVSASCVFLTFVAIYMCPLSLRMELLLISTVLDLHQKKSQFHMDPAVRLWAVRE